MSSEILSLDFMSKRRKEQLSALREETEGFYIIIGLKDRILAMLREAYDLGYEQGADDHF
jgi:hypothetical protein